MTPAGAAEAWIRRWWRGDAGLLGGALTVSTLPLGGLYGAMVALRNVAWDRGLRRAHRPPVPVLSVGNLVVGGTGKTPVTGWLTGKLLDRDVRPGVLLRGYGDDEVRLHRRWAPGAVVVADPDRRRGAELAAARGAEAIVLDDGFQHRALARDVDLVLVAAEHDLPGRLLPRGPYREPASALARADLVIVTRRVADEARATAVGERVRALAPGVPLATLRLRAGRWTDLAGAGADPPRGPLLAVAGVADAGAFAQLVERSTGSAVELLAFPDHRRYDEGDVARIEAAAAGRPVATTEKDAVKLVAWGERLMGARVLGLDVVLETGAGAIDDAVERVASTARKAGKVA